MPQHWKLHAVWGWMHFEVLASRDKAIAARWADPTTKSYSIQSPKGAWHTSPGCNPGNWELGTGWKFAMRSEGTPHRPVADGLCGDMQRSFRTRKWPGCFSQGVALRWYAMPRWGKNSMPQRGKDVVSNKFPIWLVRLGCTASLQIAYVAWPHRAICA